MYPTNEQFSHGPSWAGSDGAKGAFGAAGMMEARRRKAAQDGNYAASSGNGGPGFLAGLDIGGRRRKHMEATFDRISEFAKLEHSLNQGTMTTAAGLETGLIGSRSAASINETKAGASAKVREINATGRNQRAGVTNAALATGDVHPRTTGLKIGADGGAEMSFGSPKTPAKPRATANPGTPKPARAPKPAK
jgi:hypothetical protein